GKRAFIKRYSGALNGNKEAEKVYKAAAKQMSAALMLQAESNPAINNTGFSVLPQPALQREDQQNEIDNNPQLQVLFGSQDYCECRHCRSSLSPAAYLADLIIFLNDAENVADTPPLDPQNEPLSAWGILQERRPDIVNMELSCENTNTTLPYIDLVNEVLEHAITGNNDSRQTTLDSKTLLSEPEHIDPLAYDTLAQQDYPWLLPFHLWNEEAHAYLGKLDISRSDIIHALEGHTGQITPIAINEASVYLGISGAMQSILTDNTDLSIYYDVVDITTLEEVPELLSRSGLSYDELLEVLETQFVNPNGETIDLNLPPDATPSSQCSLENATLNLTPTDFRGLHRFKRLQRILDWEVSTLDMAITAFNAATINDDLIMQLTGIKKLEKRFRLPVPEILSWFAPLSERAYGDEVSQYDTIFLNPVYNTDAAVRTVFADADVNPLELITGSGDLNTANTPVVLGALRMRSTYLPALISAELPNGPGGEAPGQLVDKAQLSHLFRVASFTRALRISVQEYLDWQLLTGIQPLSTPANPANPDSTLAFLRWYDLIRERNISLDELNFLLRHSGLTAFPDSTESQMIASLTALRETLQTKLGEKDITIDLTNETVDTLPIVLNNNLKNLFSLFMEERIALVSVAIVEDTSGSANTEGIDGTAVNTAVFITQNWQDHIADTTDAVNQLTGPGALSDLQARYDYIVQAFYPRLAEVLLFSEEVQRFWEESTQDSNGIIGLLLHDELEHPGIPGTPAITAFTTSGFVLNNDSITAATHGDHITLLLQLQKIVLVAEKLTIKDTQLTFVLNHGTDSGATGWYNLRALPTVYTAGINQSDFHRFVNLIQAFGLEKRYATADFSIIQLIEDAAGGADAATLQQALSDGTGWQLNDIQYLIASPDLNVQFQDYQQERWLLQLEGVFMLMDTLGVSAAQLSDWGGQDITFEQARAIRLSVKSNYDTTSWYKISEELRNGLRIKQRDALSAYLVANTPEFYDTNDLYAYYLIDTEMAPCMITSRIKLAISTTQLWVQRIRMDMEQELIRLSEEDLDEWNWRKNYRVWEAARKVFLYPENWIEPELRDDKSPFFLELEDELLQDEVTAEKVENVYLNYLYKLDEVDHLEVSGVHLEEDRNRLHVFARTKNEPHIYFYRRQEDGFRWTAWERMDLDIEGDHLIPVIFNRRLMLFWAVMNLIPVEITDEQLNVTTKNGGDLDQDVTNKNPLKKVEIQMAYSEFKNDVWQPKKLSKEKVTYDGGRLPENYFFKVAINQDGLFIDTFYWRGAESGYLNVETFYLNNCSGALVLSGKNQSAAPEDYVVVESVRKDMKLVGSSESRVFEIAEELEFNPNIANDVNENFRFYKETILNATPSRFKITHPLTGDGILSEMPFFYEDGDRVFFVTPSEEVYEENLVIQLNPKTIKRSFKLPVKKTVPKTIKKTPKKRTVQRAFTSTENVSNTGPQPQAFLDDLSRNMLK
ncbi:MAG: neuraminidase-like domain-containing protein, partial [Bacteroidota bacterium]